MKEKALIPVALMFVGQLIIGCCFCESAFNSKAVSESTELVQEVCSGRLDMPQSDAWGHLLQVRRGENDGIIVLSFGADGRLDRPIDEYWEIGSCGLARFPEGDIVCVNQKLRRWPEEQFESDGTIEREYQECLRWRRKEDPGLVGLYPD